MCFCPSCCPPIAHLADGPSLVPNTMTLAVAPRQQADTMQIDYVLPDVMAATPSNIFHNLSDADLIGAIALGHGPAMQILFALHSVKPFRFVLRLVCDFSLAEDVVSKAFLDVWRQAGNFQGRSSVPTWVLTLVRRRALTALQALTTGKLDNNNSARTTE